MQRSGRRWVKLKEVYGRTERGVEGKIQIDRDKQKEEGESGKRVR